MKKVRTHLLATAAVVALSGSAFAADMGLPMKAAPAPAPIPYAGWQGWYLGGSIGAARLNSSATLTGSPVDSTAGCGVSGFTRMAGCSTAATGFTAGVQLGYDWQTRYFVYGVVADWTWTGLKHTVHNTGASCHPFFTAKVDWLATFRGRMGLAVDDTLVYFTGGLALGELKSSAGISTPFDNNLNMQINKVEAGWVAGLGVEHKFSQNWSVFAEFLYYDFGHTSASASNDSGGYTTEFTHEIMQGKVGLNYRF